jgi:hypothetical protein
VFVIVPAVVLGGMMPTNAPSMSPRAKLTAARPKTGGAASCQRSVVGGGYGCDVEAGSLAGSSSNEGKHASSVDREEFHCNDINGTKGKRVGVDCEYP